MRRPITALSLSLSRAHTLSLVRYFSLSHVLSLNSALVKFTFVRRASFRVRSRTSLSQSLSRTSLIHELLSFNLSHELLSLTNFSLSILQYLGKTRELQGAVTNFCATDGRGRSGDTHNAVPRTHSILREHILWGIHIHMAIRIMLFREHILYEENTFYGVYIYIWRYAYCCSVFRASKRVAFVLVSPYYVLQNARLYIFIYIYIVHVYIYIYIIYIYIYIYTYIYI